MAVPAFLVAEERRDQLVLGAVHLAAGLVVVPLLAVGVVSVATRLNILAFGELAPWQETGLALMRLFFAAFCFALALHGAARLSILALAQAGLITNPWE